MEKIETTDILNSIELYSIIKFNDDRIMSQAVKKYLLAHLYQNGVITPGKPHNPVINWACSAAFGAISPPGDGHGRINTNYAPKTDAELGADLRATAKGIQIIEIGFKELSEIKKPEVLKEEAISSE